MVSPRLWHLRLGHVSDSELKLLSTYFPLVTFQNSYPCDVCQFARQRKLAFVSSTTKSMQIFELLHVDIWGPCSTTSITGYKYFLTIIDDFSQFTWIKLMKHKNETKDLKEFC